MVGRSLIRALKSHDIELLSAPHSELDLTGQRQTYLWLQTARPDVIFMAAGRVGGIGANMACPADFIRDNLMIAQNVIEGAYRAGVERLLYLGSSCIYPTNAAQPIVEEALLTGPLEETNEAYAVAKIAGLKLCTHYRRQFGCSFISAMPTNLYGPHDRFHADHSHVIPAMMMKFHRAKENNDSHVVLWGTGNPLREFLHVDDLANALVHMAGHYDGETALNIGSGEEINIRALAALMKDITGYQGAVLFDDGKPDGMMRKCLDSSKIRALGWVPSVCLEEGLKAAYAWYCAQENALASAPLKKTA